MHVGDLIRTARKEKGLSQKDVASRLNISCEALSQYETGKRKPKIETVKKISAAIGIPSNFLITAIANDFELITGNDNTTSSDFINSGYREIDKIGDVIILQMYRKLNKDGKRIAVERIAELTEMEEYKTFDN